MREGGKPVLIDYLEHIVQAAGRPRPSSPAWSRVPDRAIVMTAF